MRGSVTYRRVWNGRLHQCGELYVSDQQAHFLSTHRRSGSRYVVAARHKAVNAGLVDPAGIGYCCGGYTSYPTRSNEVDGIIFGTDTAVNPAAALSSTLAESMGASSATAGYVMGGESTSFNSYIRKFDFAAETFSLLAGVLSATVSRGCGVNSLTVGYTLGGNSSSFVTTDSIDGVDFASDTGNNPSAVLSTAKRHQASLSNKV